MKYVKELSNMYWARPENALWISRGMQKLELVKFKAPILDLMCGHGMWSFIRAGGEFGYSWDSYKVLQNVENYQSGVDIQDTFSNLYKPEIVRSPEYRIDCGLDLKENNLEKCKTLNFYDRLVQADCNKALPFLDDEFSTIFSNTVYWVDDIDLILSELSRIVKPEGKVVLINYLPAINDYLKIYQGQVSNQWMELIDRNRSIENKHIFSKQEWINRFDRAGLEVTRYIPTVNKLYAHIWNIGLRPFAGFILEMGQELSPEKYVEVKRQWVNTVVTLIEPLLRSSYFNEIKDGEEAEAIFVLKKK